MCASQPDTVLFEVASKERERERERERDAVNFPFASRTMKSNCLGQKTGRNGEGGGPRPHTFLPQKRPE
jgi:hypothetical protein